ncbi:MAG: serine/threonine protein kinase [Rhodospirillales bacterium]|nr:MAG: serine/threonine protein kinase [Rhodospirillales bacterium]
MNDRPSGGSGSRGLHFGALPTGYRLGPYIIQSVIGSGGFGTTYRAVDDRLRRPVAIKEFLPNDVAVRTGGVEVRPRSPADQETFDWGLRRFLDEARTLAVLADAPNIVHVHDFLEANGTGYMVMELVEGEPLSSLIKRVGPIPWDRLSPVLPLLLRGMEAVHRAGYLHRDIKPANIVIRTNGEPVLLDFGAARTDVGKRTQVMTSIYSPGYAPPEQYGGGFEGKQGPWSDIYGLAATLYQAITGTAPVEAASRLLSDTLTPATQAAAGRYPPGFLAAVDAGLSLSIERRPQSIAAWSQMLFGDGPNTTGAPAFAVAAGAGALGAAGAAAAAPGGSRGGPGQTFGGPGQSFGAPGQSYAAPGQTFSGPGQGYAAPGQSFSGPGQTFGAPPPGGAFPPGAGPGWGDATRGGPGGADPGALFGASGPGAPPGYGAAPGYPGPSSKGAPGYPGQASVEPRRRRRRAAPAGCWWRSAWCC